MYVFPFRIVLNLGVLINADFFLKCPSNTAMELCKDNPIATEKKRINRPKNLKKPLKDFPKREVKLYQ
jgi:hypothetical protein